MTARAAGSFTVKGWDENTYAELDGKTKLTKATMTFDFTGDLEATGTCETVMFYREDGSATFTGLQHMVGRIGGQEGSFVLQADGAYDGGEARSAWQVIDGSATGALKGLSGAGSSVAASGEMAGTFTLDYDLG